MGQTVSASFTAIGNGTPLLVNHKDTFSYDVSGTFVGTVIVEKSSNLNGWETVATATGAASASNIVIFSRDQNKMYVRFQCTDFTSGTIVTSLTNENNVVREIRDESGTVIERILENSVSVVRRVSQELVVSAAGQAKAGTTAGFVVAAGDNVALVTCPANSTASTLVIPIPALKVGSIITAFSLIGQIESAGGTVTVDAALRSQTAAAADVTDALVGAITQVSVIADTALSSSNSEKSGLSETVAVGVTHYVLVTATTGVATDIALQGVRLVYTET